MKKVLSIMSLFIFILTSACFCYWHVVKRIEGESFQYTELDLLAIGDSNLYSAFSPRLYYQLYESESYVMANPNQTILETYLYLKEFLEQTKPNMILFEVNPLFCSYNKETVQKISVKPVEYMQSLEQRKDYLDGYGFYESQKCIPYLLGNYMKPTAAIQPIGKTTQQYFEDIVQLCQTHQVQLILLSVPSAIDWSMPKHNQVSFLANQYGLTYIDLNLSQDVNIHWLTDSRDGGIHLNNNGAIKVTSLIGKIIKNII